MNVYLKKHFPSCLFYSKIWANQRQPSKETACLKIKQVIYESDFHLILGLLLEIFCNLLAYTSRSLILQTKSMSLIKCTSYLSLNGHFPSYICMYYASCLIQLYCNEIVAPFKVVELENNQKEKFCLCDERFTARFCFYRSTSNTGARRLFKFLQSLTFNVAFSKDVK